MATLITTNVNGTLTTTGTITSGNAFVLPGGFTINHPGSGYAQFSSWVFLTGAYGFYSSLNSAHIYPNNGTYGSWRMGGSRAGWQGIEFGSGTVGAVTLMINTDSNTSGFHNNAYGWQFRWNNGTLYVGKAAYGGGTDATVLDSSNAAYAWNMNQYVRTTDSVEFDNIIANGDLKVIGAFRDSSGSVGSSGQILSSTVTGTAWIAAPSGGGTLSGSGTANYVPKWTGSTSLGNSIIYESGSSVGIGTTSLSYNLDVSGTIRATGDIIAYSDARVKENVKTISDALNKVKALRGVSYNKIGETKNSVGVIAQELLGVIPEAVQQDNEGMYSVAYGNLVGVLIEAIKEQQHQIEELKTEIQNLKSN
jgi:hypothetical protein